MSAISAAAATITSLITNSERRAEKRKVDETQVSTTTPLATKTRRLRREYNEALRGFYTAAENLSLLNAILSKPPLPDDESLAGAWEKLEDRHQPVLNVLVQDAEDAKSIFCRWLGAITRMFASRYYDTEMYHRPPIWDAGYLDIFDLVAQYIKLTPEIEAALAVQAAADKDDEETGHAVFALIDKDPFVVAQALTLGIYVDEDGEVQERSLSIGKRLIPVDPAATAARQKKHTTQ